MSDDAGDGSDPDTPYRRCYFCGVSTIRKARTRRFLPAIRSYQLTKDYLALYPYINEYSRHQFSDTRHITQEDRICRPCLQRAGRFFIRAQLTGDQVEERRQIVIDEPFVPSASDSPVSSSAASLVDPLEVFPLDPADNVPEPEVVQDIQEEVGGQNDIIIPPAVQAENLHIPVFPVPGFSRLPHTSVCIFRDCRNVDLTRIPINLRKSVLTTKNLYITRGSRACQEHMQSELWQNFEDFCRPKIETFNSSQISDMLNLLQKNSTDRIDFERLHSIEDRVFYFYIGYPKEIFLSVLEQTPSISRVFKKKPKTALATVMCKLHTGDSNERLSTIFRMTPQHFSAVMRKTRRCLITEFVPKHLGLNHLYSAGSGDTYRRELYDRILRVPNVLYGSLDGDNVRLITIADGTYFYIQKSSNYAFQRKTYSLHKYRNLIKVFLMVCPDGYIVEAYGPYPANMSDAEILSDVMRVPETDDDNIDNAFHWFFQKDDVFILDRGFRDVIEEVEECGYQAYMPKTKDDNERQLTTVQANESRKVTLCRWVVETINGRLKNQFRQLRNKNSNLAVPHMYEEVRIACALINAFGARLTDNDLVNEIINQIYLKHDSPNRLSNLIIENHFNLRRAHFRSIDAVQGFGQFPELTYDDLIIMSVGPYQVQQGRSYYAEHLKENGTYIIELFEDRPIEVNLSSYNIVTAEPWLVRARIQSRHQNRRTYMPYILIDDGLQGRSKIVEYYCICLVGKRTLGCCAHVMSVVWYLGWARHQDPLPAPPAGFLDTLFEFTDDEDL